MISQPVMLFVEQNRPSFSASWKVIHGLVWAKHIVCFTSNVYFRFQTRFTPSWLPKVERWWSKMLGRPVGDKWWHGGGQLNCSRPTSVAFLRFPRRVSFVQKCTSFRQIRKVSDNLQHILHIIIIIIIIITIIIVIVIVIRKVSNTVQQILAKVFLIL